MFVEIGETKNQNTNGRINVSFDKEEQEWGGGSFPQHIKKPSFFQNSSTPSSPGPTPRSAGPPTPSQLTRFAATQRGSDPGGAGGSNL